MKRHLLFIFLLSSPFFVLSQHLDRYVLASQGGFDQGKTMSISWTLGQVFTETVAKGQKALTQGFQQPDFAISLIDRAGMEEMHITLYPNPTRGRLTLKAPAQSGKYQVEIIDMTGRILYSEWHSEQKTDLNLTQYPSGQYVVRVSDATNSRQTIYSVIKQ